MDQSRANRRVFFKLSGERVEKRITILDRKRPGRVDIRVISSSVNEIGMASSGDRANNRARGLGTPPARPWTGIIPKYQHNIASVSRQRLGGTWMTLQPGTLFAVNKIKSRAMSAFADARLPSECAPHDNSSTPRSSSPVDG